MTDVLPGDYDVQITGNNGCSSYFAHTVEMTSPDENPICIVSVDTVLGGNLVVWEPVQTTELIIIMCIKKPLKVDYTI